jgi:hypothetical protein
LRETSMPDTPEATKPPSPEEILAGILAGLRSENAQDRLDAIQKLNEQKFSSPAILRTLEELAINDGSKAVREAIRLVSPTHRYIQSRIASLNHKERQAILLEIADWENRGLVPTNQADVIRQRYNFDLKPAEIQAILPALPTRPEPSDQSFDPGPPARRPTGSESTQDRLAPVKEDIEQPQPATPRPGLTQTLLSETSIKIALYLGAFFVVAAAAILAAVVEAARLPILLAATAPFAGGAVVSRARLLQPSFALFIVFLSYSHRRQRPGGYS